MQINIFKSYLLFLLSLLYINNLELTYAQINSHSFVNQEVEQNLESTIQIIDSDYTKGVITIDEWIKNIVYCIFDTNKLLPRYADLERDVLTTSVTVKIFNNWSKLKTSTKQELQSYGFNKQGALSVPKYLLSTNESIHFKFHYSIVQGDSNAISSEDSDLNGIPDYIDMMIVVFEDVFTSETNTMGFTPPPSDSGNIGENSKYDVYILKLGRDLLGSTSPFTTIGDNPNSSNLTEKNATTSYINMRNDYSGFVNNSLLGRIQNTASHEFFHAIEFGYDVKEMTWLMEATATWIEDEVFENLNYNIIYLDTWFRVPTIPLDANKTESRYHWYGSWIFFKYISEHLGGYNTIKKIWEKSVDYDSKVKDYSILIIDEVLQTKNSSFKNVFKEFAISNLFQTTAPYNYKDASKYPSVRIARKIFQSKKNINYHSKRYSSRYIRIYPNVLSGDLDEIEITVTPENVNAKLELVVTTKTNGIINYESSELSGETIKYSLKNSSKKDEIYAIIVNLDTTKTDYTLEITYKGNLIKLNNSGNYNYGSLSDNYYIFNQSYNYTDSNGDFHTDFVVSRYGLKSGYISDYLFKDTGGLSAYLAKSDGDMFIIAYDLNRSQNINYGYHFISLKELAGEFEVNQYPAVDNNKMFFYGDYYSPDYSKGIFSTDLKTGPPQMILDLTNTDFAISVIESEGSSFAALKNNFSIPNSDELLYFSNNSLNTFYTPDAENNVMSLVYNNDFAAWSEIDNGFSNTSIKAYDFSTNNLKTIRAVNGLDVWSVATSNKRVVWWENTTGATKIKLWMNDTTTTIRSTFNGLYLDDNGVSSSSFDIPIDTGGVAWMENDFTLYYYNFRSSSLNSYDLSSYFTDKSMTTYLVKLSGKNIIIEALSTVNTEKVGIYLFKIGDITTGINDDKETQLPIEFSLSQNYPNPFNPTTVIKYSIPSTFKTRNIQTVQLKIYDILGREIKTLVDEKKPPGNYEVHFTADNLSSGIYFYRIIVGNFVQTKKMLLLQ